MTHLHVLCHQQQHGGQAAAADELHNVGVPARAGRQGVGQLFNTACCREDGKALATQLKGLLARGQQCTQPSAPAARSSGTEQAVAMAGLDPMPPPPFTRLLRCFMRATSCICQGGGKHSSARRKSQHTSVQPQRVPGCEAHGCREAAGAPTHSDGICLWNRRVQSPWHQPCPPPPAQTVGLACPFPHA